MKTFKHSVLLLGLIFISACASTTTIRSTDPNTRIYVDGEYRGVGSTVHTDKKIVGSTTHVRMERDGCAPVSTSFSRNEDFNVGACIGGVFLLVPFLWVMDYKPERTFEYRCQPVTN